MTTQKLIFYAKKLISRVVIYIFTVNLIKNIASYNNIYETNTFNDPDKDNNKNICSLDKYAKPLYFRVHTK